MRLSDFQLTYNPDLFNISYNQISYFLQSSGWVLKETIKNTDIYSLDTGDKTAEVLLPHDDQSESYKHRLLDILLILQYQQSPSLIDIHWQIKKFCLDFCTQENSYE